MDTLRQQAIKYVDIHVSRFIDELSAFCAIPSVSTEPIHKKDMHLTAEWLENQLHKIGFPHTKIFATAGHPILYGEYLTKVPKAKTVLVYGHYDVQPADPLEK
jgi:acetylornithine deacetylase/succinyl-diaminopimelate desuccinylase-like protein